MIKLEYIANNIIEMKKFKSEILPLYLSTYNIYLSFVNQTCINSAVAVDIDVTFSNKN